MHFAVFLSRKEPSVSLRDNVLYLSKVIKSF